MAVEVAEGWYADPQGEGPGHQRWWNGHHWTAHTRVVDATPAAAGSAVAGAQAGDARTQAEPEWGERTGTPVKRLPDGTPLAAPGQRAAAYLVDVVLVWIVANLLSGIVGLTFGVSGRFLVPDGAPWSVLDGWVDPVALAGGWVLYQLAFRPGEGRTVGKRLLQLRVRPLDAEGTLTADQVLRRAILGSGGVLCVMFPPAQLVGVTLLGLDLHRMGRDPHDRPWHDQVAGTAVVRVRR